MAGQGNAKQGCTNNPGAFHDEFPARYDNVDALSVWRKEETLRELAHKPLIIQNKYKTSTFHHACIFEGFADPFK
ncbi:MAG: hypothetical protein ABTQ26_15840 [Azonexus sp.]